MPWARFDEDYPMNRKVRRLSDAAFRMDVSAVCWSNKHMTDGKIPRDDLSAIGDCKAPAKAAAELVSKGRWLVTDDGWEIHDFLVYNLSREKVLAERQAAKERQRKAREAAQAKAQSRRASRSTSQRDSQRDSDGTNGVNTKEVQPPRPEGSKEPLSPTGDDDDSRSPGQLAVAAWLDRLSARPLKGVVSRFSAEVREALDAGYAADPLIAAAREAGSKGYTTLGPFLVKAKPGAVEMVKSRAVEIVRPC